MREKRNTVRVRGRWSQTHRNAKITITKGGSVASSIGNTNVSIAGDIVFENGVVTWEVANTNKQANIMSMIVGVIPVSKLGVITGGSHIGDTTLCGWGIYTSGVMSAYHLQKFQQVKAPQTNIGQNDYTIGFRLDCNKRILTAFVNGLKARNYTNGTMWIFHVSRQ